MLRLHKLKLIFFFFWFKISELETTFDGLVQMFLSQYSQHVKSDKTTPLTLVMKSLLIMVTIHYKCSES